MTISFSSKLCTGMNRNELSSCRGRRYFSAGVSRLSCAIMSHVNPICPFLASYVKGSNILRLGLSAGDREMAGKRDKNWDTKDSFGEPWTLDIASRSDKV